MIIINKKNKRFMKKIYLLAAAAALFAACSSSDDLAVKEQPQVQSEPGAVGFDAYLQRATTRAGFKGSDIGLTQLQTNSFGVFAYYTDNNEYDPLSIPNLMYNQKVEFIGGYWQYAPIVYWPNEYGTNAASDDNDKVSFFAYAPYVDVVPSTGKIDASADEAKWGITGMNRNIASGDPLIKYLVSFDEDKKVDLCWGVCDDPQWNTINDGTQLINNEKGLPWLNVQRPQNPAALSASTGQKVKFQFKHALAKLNVNIDTYADGTAAADINEKSRVYVRSITFTGFATKGTLNLDNTEPNKAYWLDYNGTADLENGEEVTIYDGRKDGKEGTAGGIATNEKVQGLNPNLIQDENQLSGNAFITSGETGYHSGVTGSPQNLFRKFDGSKYIAAENGIYVIPTGEPVKITIVYDVETPDQQLGVYLSDGKTPGSTIENRIEKEVNFGTAGLENGKEYTINLHLGMNSVKLDADVTPWVDGGPGQDVDLPSNIPSFAAAVDQEYDFSVEAKGGPIDVKLYGFNGGESITNNAGLVSPVTTCGAGPADSQGTLVTTFTVSANDKVEDLPGGIALWTGNASGKQVKLKITQKAHALALNHSAVAVGDQTITLTSGAGAMDWSKVKTISVERNGVLLTKDTSAAPGKFSISGAVITLDSGEKLVSGDTFKITVQAGDAPEETITFKVS